MITEIKAIEYYGNEVFPKVFYEDKYKIHVNSIKNAITLYRSTIDTYKGVLPVVIESDLPDKLIGHDKIEKLQLLDIIQIIMTKELHNVSIDTQLDDLDKDNPIFKDLKNINFRFGPLGSIYGALFNLIVSYLHGHED